MPRGNMSLGKAKDFKTAIKKLLAYLKPYMTGIIVAIVLVIISTVCSLIGPNRLSEITDIIEQGISVNISLSEEEFATLKTEKTYTKISDSYTLFFSYDEKTSDDGSDDEIGVTLTYNGQDITLPAVTMGSLTSESYINYDNYNMGISYADGSLNLWLNTETKVDMEKIFKICMILAVIYLTAYVVNFLQGFIMATINQRVSKDLRNSISSKINRLPLKYFDSTSYGDVLSRVTNDVDLIGQTLNNSVSTLIGAAAMFVGSIIMMFVTNWILAIAGILASLVGFVLMMFIIKKSQKYFIKQQQTLGATNGIIEEVYSGQEIIKAYNAEEETSEKFEQANTSLYNTAWKAQFYSGLMQPIMSFIGNFSYVVVCVLGAVLVYYGQIGFSVIVAIMIYIRLFTQPLSQLAQGVSNLQSTAAASERVFELLEQPELSDESHLTKHLDINNIKGDVEFKNVKFAYTPDKMIIKNFSARIHSGQKVAIVGPTGAGKTTLVNLLMKFYDILDGDILIDDVSIKELPRENIHDIFGMVLQDTWLFEGTIKENIRYSKQDVTDDQIVEACKECGIDHFIMTLPKGYDTVLDDNTSISAGQKQLMTIARAMVQNSPMLILDEATSSVDTRTEILIQNAMDRLTQNRTSFIIAHRLSTIKNADLILVIRDGDIVEQGTHADLLAKGGFYAELYNSQFEEID